MNLDGSEYRQMSNPVTDLDTRIGYLNLFCERTPINRNFKNVICVSSTFFAFTVYYTNNPLKEFCHIHLNINAVGRHHKVYQELL